MGMMDRFLNLIGFEEVEQPGEEAQNRGTHEEDTSRRRSTVKAPVVSLPNPRQPNMRVVVMEPKSMEESQLVADHLKARRPVVLNLEGVDKDLAQKFLNFLGGTVYALDGTMQRVGTSIFLFAPSNVEISLKEREELRERGLGIWSK